MPDDPAEDYTADVVPIFSDSGELQDVVPADSGIGLAARDKAREGARKRRAVFRWRKEGATRRATELPKELVGPVAFGVVNLMGMKLLQEEIQPTTAKEAAEVSKVFNEIARQTLGGGKSDTAATPEERARLENDAKALRAQLLKRAAEADRVLGDAALGGAPDDDDLDDVDTWEGLDDGPVPDPDGE